jgi:hypothetical protein
MNEPGFEYQGTFYRWSVSDMGKDLMLIDRFCGLPIVEFFELVDDDFDRGRAPILLSMIATSIRKEHPDWSVERIVRTVQELNLSEIAFVGAEEEEDSRPLPDATSVEAGPPTGEPSASPSNGSSSSSTPTDNSTSEMLSATPP